MQHSSVHSGGKQTQPGSVVWIKGLVQNHSGVFGTRVCQQIWVINPETQVLAHLQFIAQIQTCKKVTLYNKVHKMLLHYLPLNKRKTNHKLTST